LATLLNIENAQFVDSGITRVTTNSNYKKKESSREDVERLMKELWVELNETAPGCIPPGIIFLSGDRLSTSKGFGWAPLTWMSGQEVDYPDPLSIIGSPAVLMEKGLSVQYPGFLLHAKNYTSIAQFGDANDFHFPVDSTLQEWYCVAPKDAMEASNKRPKGNHQHKQLAIILCRHRPKEIEEIALLVEIEKEIKQREIGGQRESRVYQVYIVCRVMIKREVRESVVSKWKKVVTQTIRQTSAEDDDLNRVTDGRDNVGNQADDVQMESVEEPLIFGEILESTQRWYVDGRTVNQVPTDIEDEKVESDDEEEEVVEEKEEEEEEPAQTLDKSPLQPTDAGPLPSVGGGFFSNKLSLPWRKGPNAESNKSQEILSGISGVEAPTHPRLKTAKTTNHDEFPVQASSSIAGNINQILRAETEPLNQRGKKKKMFTFF
jgi:hypothetical protein